MKKCSDCTKSKPLTDFWNNKAQKDGKEYACKDCKKKQHSKYGPKSRANRKEKHATYMREYNQKNPEARRKVEAKRRNSDLQFRMIKNLRNRMNYALKNFMKKASVTKSLGCTKEQFKQHFESRFDDNMNWANYGSYWHIDHIKPLTAFNLQDKNEQAAANHYSNLQPLEKIENIKKGNKYVGI